MSIVSISLNNYHSLPEALRKNNKWELEAELNEEDPILYNEVWAMDMLINWGSYALGKLLNEKISAILVYGPAQKFALSTKFTAGPVSADAILITRVIKDTFITIMDEVESTENIETELLSGAINNLTHRGVKAIEAFGYVDIDHDKYDCFSCELLENNGFTLVKDDKKYRRYRRELSEDLAWKKGVEAALNNLLIDVTKERTVLLV